METPPDQAGGSRRSAPGHDAPFAARFIHNLGSSGLAVDRRLVSALAADGGWLVIADGFQGVGVFEVATGKETVRPPEPWSAADRQRLAEQLAGDDAKAAFQAVRRLVRNPGPAVRLLREHLKPAGPIDAKRVRQRLDELDSGDFDTRQAASTELERLGDRIEALLREALTGERPLEAKRRIEALLAKMDLPTPERLARCRGLEALEQIATADAMQLVDALAAGEAGARLSRDAAATRQRLKQRAQ
jgi:hypothetical protein